MYGRCHLQFMKVSNQEVEIRVHYSQQDNWIIPAPTLVRAGEGEGWEKTGYFMHESQASVLILVEMSPLSFLLISFTVLMLSKYDSATTLKLTHTLPPDSLLRKQLTKYPQGKKLSCWQSIVFTETVSWQSLKYKTLAASSYTVWYFLKLINFFSVLHFLYNLHCDLRYWLGRGHEKGT